MSKVIAALFLIFMTAFVPATSFAAPLKPAPKQTVFIGVPGYLLEQYNQFLKGREVGSIKDFKSEAIGYSAFEVYIFQWALQQADYKNNVKLVQVETMSSAYEELEAETISAYAIGTMSLDNRYKDFVHETTPFIPQGEFTVGIYVLATSPALATKPENIKQLKGATGLTWDMDIATLKKVGFKFITKGSWVDVANAVKSGEADFFAMPFEHNMDMSLTFNDTKFLPIPGVKLEMQGNREFLVRTGKTGDQLLNALNDGIKKLRASGQLRKALEEINFYDVRTKDWKIIK
jgi:ABC-type amino acid transport substrate-binding protein